MPTNGLEATAAVPQRLEALQAVGLTTSAVAEAVGVSEATVRSWSDGTTRPREGAERALDDLRTAVVALADASIEGPAAARWLTSRHTDPLLSGRRPIEILRVAPLDVLLAIGELILAAREAEDETSRQVHLRLVEPPDSEERGGEPEKRVEPRRSRARLGRAGRKSAGARKGAGTRKGAGKETEGAKEPGGKVASRS